MNNLTISALLSLVSAVIIIIMNFYLWYSITYEGKPVAKKWGKILLCVSFLFILASSLFLLLNQSRNEENKQFVFEKQTECREVCSEIHKSIEEESEDSSIFNPKYNYNKEKNMCFYSGGILTGKTLSRYVINCQTNEEVLSLITIDSEVFLCEGCESSFKNFKEKELEYLN